MYKHRRLRRYPTHVSLDDIQDYACDTFRQVVVIRERVDEMSMELRALRFGG